MIILPIQNTIMNSVTYLLYSDEIEDCILIDCGEYSTLKPILDNIGKKVTMVLLTHGHSDHIYGLTKLIIDNPKVLVGTTMDGHTEIQSEKLNLSYLHGEPFAVRGYQELILSDRQSIHINGMTDIDVIATPGHDSSCLTYKVGNNLFTGDAYIPGIKVFYKFPRGNKTQALCSYQMLANMEKEGYKIYCGHHSFMLANKNHSL